MGYDPEHKITYWFSYDRDNLELVYGKGRLIMKFIFKVSLIISIFTAQTHVFIGNIYPGGK